MGPAIVAHLDGSSIAKERLELILETLAGQVSVVSACQILDISEAMFYKLRNRILQGCIEDLEPKPRGRPPRLVTGDEARSEELATQVATLERELAAQAMRQDLAQAIPHVARQASPGLVKKTKLRTRRGRPHRRRHQK
jgi:transposase-like protein